jgi:hypothetical protein
MWTKEFWKDAGERAFKTFLQTLGVLWVVADGMFNIWEANLITSLQLAVSAAVLSLITSAGSAPFGTKSTASLTSDVHYVPLRNRHTS